MLILTHKVQYNRFLSVSGRRKCIENVSYSINYVSTSNEEDVALITGLMPARKHYGNKLI